MNVTSGVLQQIRKLLRLILNTYGLFNRDARPGQSRASLYDLHELSMIFFQEVLPFFVVIWIVMSVSLSFLFTSELACTLVKTQNIISLVAALIDRQDR